MITKKSLRGKAAPLKTQNEQDSEKIGSAQNQIRIAEKVESLQQIYWTAK